MHNSHLRIWLRLLDKLKSICKTEIRVQTFKLKPPQSSSVAEPILFDSMNKYVSFAFSLMQIKKAVTHSMLLQMPRSIFITTVH